MVLLHEARATKYLRLVVPKNMQKQVGRRDIFKSLGTDSERAASLIVGIMGDKPFSQYKHEDFRHLQEVLQEQLAPTKCMTAQPEGIRLGLF